MVLLQGHVVGPLVAVPVQVVLLQAHAAHEHAAQLAEGGNEPVVGPHRHERADRVGLLALVQHVGGHPSLAVEAHRPFVDLPREHHGPVGGQRLLVAQERNARGRGREPARLVQEGEELSLPGIVSFRTSCLLSRPGTGSSR